ncbi:hypothetical protein D3C86_1345290 [compost metagenome]
MHSFDDDDGIIYHDTNGQYQGKECKDIDRKAEGQQEEEGTYNCHRYGYCRDDGGTEILEEQEYYNEHKDKRLDQCRLYLSGGFVQTVFGTHHTAVFNTRREGFGRFLQLFLYPDLDLIGIGARGLQDRNGNGILTVQFIISAIADRS